MSENFEPKEPREENEDEWYYDFYNSFHELIRGLQSWLTIEQKGENKFTLSKLNPENKKKFELDLRLIKQKRKKSDGSIKNYPFFGVVYKEYTDTDRYIGGFGNPDNNKILNNLIEVMEKIVTAITFVEQVFDEESPEQEIRKRVYGFQSLLQPGDEVDFGTRVE